MFEERPPLGVVFYLFGIYEPVSSLEDARVWELRMTTRLGTPREMSLQFIEITIFLIYITSCLS